MLKQFLIAILWIATGSFLFGIVLGKLDLLWLCTLIFIILSILIWASFDLKLNFFVPAICKGQKGKIIALTFDDGPSEHTEKILDLLLKYDAKASFFCIGKQIEKYPKIAQRIINEGHILGNHTQNHPKNLGFLSATKVEKEILEAHQTIEKYLGISAKYYRPPFGVSNPNIAKALKKFNYQIIGWNNRSLDTIIHDEQRLFKRIYKKLPKKNLILMHDTQAHSVQVVEQLLKHLKNESYIFVHLDEFLNH